MTTPECPVDDVKKSTPFTPFPYKNFSPVVFRFEDTGGFYLRYQVIDVLANGDVALLAVDAPQCSRVISFEAFQKGVGFMKKYLANMSAVSRSIMTNFIEIDNFHTDY